MPVGNAKDFDVVVPMYNLIEYSDDVLMPMYHPVEYKDNYLKTGGSKKYYKDNPNDDIKDSESFKFEVNITRRSHNANTKNVEIAHD